MRDVARFRIARQMTGKFRFALNLQTNERYIQSFTYNSGNTFNMSIKHIALKNGIV